MTSSHPIPAPCQWFSRLASALDRRTAPRLAWLFLGALLARGRRAVTSWIRAAGLSDQYQSCYLAVAAAGKKAETIAAYLVLWVAEPLLGGAERLTLALDDTPTPRYGPHVQGAGVHHNPTPGPAGSEYVYGHVFVVLGLLVTHKAWGTIALPLLSRLYVRKQDLPTIDPKHRPAFRTKLELAVELLRWAKPWLGLLKVPIWVVGRLDESAAPVLDRIETRLTWTPRPDLPLMERLTRAGDAILGLKELELAGEFRHAAIADRLVRLIDEILGPLEAEWKVKRRERDVPARVRALRTAILPELVEGGLSDAEIDRRWDQLARLYLAQRLSLYPSGYLEGHPSTERVLETVERLEEDLTDAATVHRPLAVTVTVGEPLAVTADGPGPAALTSDVRDRIEALLGIRPASDRAPAPAEPPRE